MGQVQIPIYLHAIAMECENVRNSLLCLSNRNILPFKLLYLLLRTDDPDPVHGAWMECLFDSRSLSRRA